MTEITQQKEDKNSQNQLHVHYLGLVKDYKVVWDFQKKLLNKRIERMIPDSVIVVEHDHVLTLGRSSHTQNVLLKDLPIFEIERGGDVTYHGPGQLVVYPIISLQERSLGVRQYVQLLEAVVVDAISDFGIRGAEGRLGQQTGVWIGQKKIASIGVALSHMVSYHGLALNVNTDLSYFQKIKPCGFEANIMTSLSKELEVKEIDLNQVGNLVVRTLAKRLALELSEERADL